MNKYNYEVALPITGYIVVTVESDTPLEEEEAVWSAMNGDLSIDNIEEWDVHNRIVSGNVFHGIRNEAEVVDSWEEEEFDE